MKLLFDNNLSVKLVETVAHRFPESNHVFYLNIHQFTDRQIFQYAKEHNYTIVTKDKDFYHILNTLGPPPKIIWITAGNCSNESVIKILTNHVTSIEQFINGSKALLIIAK